MARYGLLIDLDRCIGCRTHELVCQEEGNQVVRQPLLTEARTTSDGNKVMQYLPFVQAKCSLSRTCAERVGQKLKPRCVLTCPAQARQFGEIEELAEYIEKKAIPHAYIIPF